MSEKLCLQWNDFKGNVLSAFRRHRDDDEFSDVTLVCEGGEQIEAHKLILAISSPIFENIFQKNKHPHPLIYLRGFQFRDLQAILDLLYFGEANVCHEKFDSFLSICQDLRLKGLTDQYLSELLKEQATLTNPTKETKEHVSELLKDQETLTNPTPIVGTKEPANHSDTKQGEGLDQFFNKVSKIVSNPNQLKSDPEALAQTVKSLMEKCQNPFTKTKPFSKAYICKVCGKEGLKHHVADHVEANHLEGISLPCDICEKTFRARNYLRKHKSKHHR